MTGRYIPAMKRPLLLLLLFCAASCGDSSAKPTPDSGTRDATVDVGRVDGPRADGAPDAAPQDGATDTRPADASLTSPYVTARGLVHMHSIYSHDACDGQGFIDGQPNLPCLAELRAAICANKLDFMFLTDHPSNMSSYTIEQDMLYDQGAGDQLVLEGGEPIANGIACSGGHGVLVSVGFEAKHMMPLGLHSLPATESSLYDGITDATPMATVQSRVAGLADHGAVTAMVHSEEDDISAATIEAGGYEAMEWYNIHASILRLLDKDSISLDIQNIAKLGEVLAKLGQLDAFISTAADAPHPDLVYLTLLDVLPPGGFDKWRTVQKTRHITGLLGSDIHRNVSFDSSTCAGAMQLVCAGALALIPGIPETIKNLALSGGTIKLSDGDRIDSYDRLMRWLENRVLVEEVSQGAIQDALRKGRAFGVFTVFGDPEGFAFTATKDGVATRMQLGDAAAGPLTLQVNAPTRPVPMRGAPFAAAAAATADVTIKLFRTDATGTALVATADGLGTILREQVSQPGAYHVELWVKPAHLTTSLGASAQLAQQTYLWVITNPIFVEP